MSFHGLGAKFERSLRKNIKVIQNSFFALNIFHFKKIVVFEKELSDPITSLKSEIEVDVRLLSSKQIRKIERFHSKKGVLERVKEGQMCFVAFNKNNKVISYCWIAINSIYLREMQREAKIAKNVAYVYDAFTVKEYRGLRIFPGLYTEVFRYLKKQGYRRVYAMVIAGNTTSLRSFEKGWERLGVITFLKIFWLKKLIFKLQKKGLIQRDLALT